MIKVEGEAFFRLAYLLKAFEHLHAGRTEGVRALISAAEKASGKQLAIPEHIVLVDQFPPPIAAGLGDMLVRFKPFLMASSLSLSLKAIDRLINALASPITWGQLIEKTKDLYSRIDDELEDLELWQVTARYRTFTETDPFKLAQSANFQSAQRDSEEAGKCLAFDRGTACVFHLMRVMEVGLRALAASLNDPRLDPKRNPSWDSILKKCDEELAKPLKDRAPEWRQDDAFFSIAAAQLHAVKDAWRNPTMHVERHYDPEEAEDVWNAVRAFMRHLAKRLSA